MPNGFFLNPEACRIGKYLNEDLDGSSFLSIINWKLYYLMEKERLKLIVRNLKLLVEALESEVYSDPAAYILTNGRTLMIPFLSLYQITTKFLMTMTDTPIEYMKQQVKLISVTPDAEKHMAYCARVSNPANQENEKFSGLLKYCVNHQHWSIFEQAYMTVEIHTTRGLAAKS